MGICEHCGKTFPRTRKSRKYCTNRCKTNACLERKPRLRASDIDALHELLGSDFDSVEGMREQLRAIIAPHLPPIPVIEDRRAPIPRMD